MSKIVKKQKVSEEKPVVPKSITMKEYSNWIAETDYKKKYETLTENSTVVRNKDTEIYVMCIQTDEKNWKEEGVPEYEDRAYDAPMFDVLYDDGSDINYSLPPANHAIASKNLTRVELLEDIDERDIDHLYFGAPTHMMWVEIASDNSFGKVTSYRISRDLELLSLYIQCPKIFRKYSPTMYFKIPHGSHALHLFEMLSTKWEKTLRNLALKAAIKINENATFKFKDFLAPYKDPVANPYRLLPVKVTDKHFYLERVMGFVDLNLTMTPWVKMTDGEVTAGVSFSLNEVRRIENLPQKKLCSKAAQKGIKYLTYGFN